ncbi:RNA polymerase sigma factor [Rubritalea tangerina]|uniref:RNA polymerase sigma factor n=2 Tax=Rubritalea tangerina TaxID=430798 RepID=A0ABW4Z8F6_9BACT
MMQGEPTSQTLLMLVKEQGDAKAWQQFELVYRRYVCAVLLKSGAAHADVEDLAQEVMVRVWKGLETFLYQPERCRFRTWLARVAKNTLINFSQLKKNKVVRAQLDDSKLYLESISQESETDVLAEIEWKIFVAKSAWEHVQSQFKEAQLQAYAGMAEGESAGTVASRLGIKENTAYVYRKAVQEAMDLHIKRLNSELDA